jgi:hypothetical protein
MRSIGFPLASCGAESSGIILVIIDLFPYLPEILSPSFNG